MKRSNIKKEKNEKSYKMDLSEVYRVVFLKDFGAFQKGEETHVSLPVAMKFVRKGVVSETEEITAAAKKTGCTELAKSEVAKEDRKKAE